MKINSKRKLDSNLLTENSAKIGWRHFGSENKIKMAYTGDSNAPLRDVKRVQFGIIGPDELVRFYSIPSAISFQIQIILESWIKYFF